MRWMYMVQRIPTTNPEEMEEELNDAGSGGWEVVSMWPQGNVICVVYKQPTGK